jgi:hypothetical protein
MTVEQRSSGERSDSLRTKREVFAVFVNQRSPQILLAGTAIVAIVRVAIGGWSIVDLGIVALTMVLTGPVEWVLHLVLLHAPADSIRMQRFGTGTGHRQHHLDPNDVGFILLRGVDAFTFQLMIAASTAAWLPLSLWLLGLQVLGPSVTGVLASFVALAHYEWVHLLVHTRYRSKTRFYKRLTANHRLHHYRNERYWLGVTSNVGDRLLRSYPQHKSDVPLSETARRLS